MTTDPSARARLMTRIDENQDNLVDCCTALVGTKSENPPGDTKAIADVAAEMLTSIDGVEIEFVTAEYPIVNLVARLKGSGAGRRLVFNGHLDTYPVGDTSLWSVDPLAGIQKDGRLYGRGVSDMKGGIAASIMALSLLSECREAWTGEVVLTLAGDEETMGTLGTYHLLETVSHARGDAMICGDAGSPKVLRFGEKGFVWVEVLATGKSAHGAHVHLGDSAIERLNEALAALFSLRDLEVPTPPEVGTAIERSKGISEALSGDGESDVLTSVTVNVGQVKGGRAPNLVADAAEAFLDIRIPVGLSVGDIETRIGALLGPMSGISFAIQRRYEPNWTSPDHEIVQLTAANCAESLGEHPVINMRVGASDSRIYRMFDIPSVVCGLTPFNMGGPDEHVLLSDLYAVGKVHALTAFDFLQAPNER
jgi:succinyl-diaminopimelate desuccinylase